ncbi:hypothetical protein GmHk_13G036544 [Glycine max]|nr:hypothetical protein GmHk_13G036544 [Glycine max]
MQCQCTQLRAFPVPPVRSFFSKLDLRDIAYEIIVEACRSLGSKQLTFAAREIGSVRQCRHCIVVADFDGSEQDEDGGGGIRRATSLYMCH